MRGAMLFALQVRGGHVRLRRVLGCRGHPAQCLRPPAAHAVLRVRLGQGRLRRGVMLQRGAQRGARAAERLLLGADLVRVRVRVMVMVRVRVRVRF